MLPGRISNYGAVGRVRKELYVSDSICCLKRARFVLAGRVRNEKQTKPQINETSYYFYFVHEFVA